ncbi:SRPBCC family protein [Luteipulveratus flavus]|uniref:SRPBCC family protein n=1 Tax=Luteipulveratus flavus TaxID=3031728 RepID=A0ABT6C3S1_9MICO|nr:SRPBCC family protein [Luteipulveratus sp. YIM 133296]MDF8263594.1 SRPBCC family protein [Luteipulveratus sp. YIM 133296]
MTQDTAVPTTTERLEASRTIPAEPHEVFAVLTDPQGHVAIDSSGMLQSADGDRVQQVGDEFVVHMDRESLGDLPMGRYDVTVTITAYEPDEEIAWTILGTVRPAIGHVYGYRLEPVEDGTSTVVTSYYDWSDAHEDWRSSGIFPVIQESALRGTLGILERAVLRGYPLESPRET